MQKPDHKKIGQELDLFCFSDLVGSGLPLWTPKGTIIRNLLDDLVWKLRKEHGYQQVDIPHLAKKELYEKSGHWDKFKDELFQIKTREEHFLVLKPMNCPHHTQIYNHIPRSYRDLPQRYANTTKVYRDEQTGELNGLARVRSITQDDAHVFCRQDQVKEEFIKIWNVVDAFYKSFGFSLTVELSFRDPENPKKYLGTKQMWDEAENQLRAIAREKKAQAVEAPGEAAFYGPKIDFITKDSLGRRQQVATIQLDVNMPERFDLTCVNEKGERERIVMIHAAIMGSLERFIAVLLEHFNGALPFWLSPVQIAVLPLTDKEKKYAENISGALEKQDYRIEINEKNETIGKKIREAELQKIPYLLIIGPKETDAKTVSVRKRQEGDLGAMPLEKLFKLLKAEVS
ncbi:MAG: threonine--tRNA ligase [bacterium]|nr:threonine--tRNA ligase [bacterium]